MKPLWLFVGAIAVLMLANWCWGDRRNAQLEAAKARADSLTRVADSLDARHTEDSVAAAREVHRLAEEARRASQRAVRAAGRADSLAGAIAAVPDSVVPKSQAIEALAAKDTVIAAKDSVIGLLAADTAAWAARWTYAVQEGQVWRNVAQRARGELAAALKRGSRKWGCTGGVSGTLALAGSSGAGFGVTCGRHF